MLYLPFILGERNFGCVYSAEIGGLNAIEPLIFGAKNNIPVADVDGVGRAVPELQVSTTCYFSWCGVPN